MSLDKLTPYFVGPIVIVKFMKFLPAGIYENRGFMINRKRSLVQLYTDPGGIRTLAAADIRFKDPGRTGR